ncbi:Autotransporter outer membrane beta-barrel domain-containing protein [Rickettsiales endosymbiont of Paramecium tredecaurelia]|nr:Autotransporter outer membrane beta-barrel domain-containing protein [Candidatus Sarmatiella mevalonica]
MSQAITQESRAEIAEAIKENMASTVQMDEVVEVIGEALNNKEDLETQRAVSILLNQEQEVSMQDSAGVSVPLTQAQRVIVAYDMVTQSVVSTKTTAASNETGAQTISMAASTALSGMGSMNASPAVGGGGVRVSTLNNDGVASGIAAGVAAGDDVSGAVWVKPFVGGGKQSKRAKQTPFDNASYGLLCGGHRQANDSLMGGVLLGYFQNDLRAVGSKLLGTRDKIGSGSILAGLYGSYTPTEKWNIQANLLFAFTRVDSKSRRSFFDDTDGSKIKNADVRAKYNSNSLSLQLLANYYAVINENSALVPSIGLYVNRNGEYSYKEEGDARVAKSESTTSASVVPQGVFGIRYLGSTIGQGYALGSDLHANVYQSFCSVTGKNTTTYANNPGSAPVPTLLPGGEKTVLNAGVGVSFETQMMRYSFACDYYAAVQTGYRAVQGVLSVDCKF